MLTHDQININNLLPRSIQLTIKLANSINMKTNSIWVGFHTFSKISSPDLLPESSIFLSTNWGISYTPSSLFTFEFPTFSPIIPLPFSLTISSISCNASMALILTTSGSVFAWGSDVNKSCLFASTTQFSSDIPIKLPKLDNRFITQVSLGESHASALCDQGYLYTWGEGPHGQLCSSLSHSPDPTQIPNSNIFHITQLLSGPSFTAVCTKGGFLYIYGSHEHFTSPSHFNQPFTVLELECHFIDSAFNSLFGIIVTTDEGRCFLLESESKLVVTLNSNKKIQMVASCQNGILGVPGDRQKLYVWTKVEGNWKSQVTRFIGGAVESVQSTSKGHVTVVGRDLRRGEKRSEINTESSPIRYREREKMEFEKLFSKYLGKGVAKSSIVSNEGCGKIVRVISRMVGRVFQVMKNYVFLTIIMKKAFASSYSPNFFERVLQRAVTKIMGEAFVIVKRFTLTGSLTDQRVKRKFKGSRKLCSIFISALNKIVLQNIVGKKELRASHITSIKYKFFAILEKLRLKRFKRPLLLILFKGARPLFYEHIVKKIRFKSFTEKLYNYFDLLINKPLINQLKHSIQRIITYLTSILKRRLEKSLRLWSRSVQTMKSKRIVTNIKKNATVLLLNLVAVHCKHQYASFFSKIKPKFHKFEHKYGAFMVYSTIKKVLNKSKIQSFNSMLRCYVPSYIEILAELLQMIFYKRTLSYLHCIKIYSMRRWNQKLVKFALFIQSYNEKIRYRQALRGLNAFKQPFFTRSMHFESFSSQSPTKIIISPCSPQPFLQPEHQLDPKIQKSQSNTTMERRASLHNLQKSLILKFSEKISSESKSSSVIGKNQEKTKQPITVIDKRNAYADKIQERQKKVLNRGKETAAIIQKKKIVKSVFDENDRKTIRYRNSVKSLKEVMSKVLKQRILKVFFYLKHWNVARRLRIGSFEDKSKGKIVKEIVGKDYQDARTAKEVKLLGKGEIKVDSKLKVPEKSVKEYSRPKANENSASSALSQVISPPKAANNWKSKLISLGLSKLERSLTRLKIIKAFKGIKALNN